MEVLETAEGLQSFFWGGGGTTFKCRFNNKVDLSAFQFLEIENVSYDCT